MEKAFVVCICLTHWTAGSISKKLRAISFDPVHNAYLVLGEKVGNAFRDGAALK